MDDNALIEKIIHSIDESSALEKSKTFLSVINKEFAETTVSRVLAYLFANDLTLVRKIVEYYYNERGICWTCPEISLDTIECEKAISNQKRIDIFMSFLFKGRERINVIVENKILAFEHGEQTNNYAQWSNRQYKDARNVFIYLKPSWNASAPTNAEFVVLTYKELVSLIQPTTNYIINDFKEYVSMLEEKDIQLSDAENTVLENYNALSRVMNEVDNKIKKFKNAAQEALVANLGLIPYVDGDAYHFYLEEWYSEANPYYYFYVEFKFLSENMDSIVFQRTVKIGTKENVLEDYLKTKDYQYAEQCKRWFVLDKTKFFSENPILSKEWQSDFIKQAKEILALYITETKEMFSDFQQYLLSRK